jgi:hypothetical protein
MIGEPVADPLDRLGVAGRAEGVVQRGERDAFLPALLLGVLVPVEVDLPGVGEIAAELDVEWAEMPISAFRPVCRPSGYAAPAGSVLVRRRFSGTGAA